MQRGQDSRANESSCTMVTRGLHETAVSTCDQGKALARLVLLRRSGGPRAFSQSARSLHKGADRSAFKRTPRDQGEIRHPRELAAVAKFSVVAPRIRSIRREPAFTHSRIHAFTHSRIHRRPRSLGRWTRPLGRRPCGRSRGRAPCNVRREQPSRLQSQAGLGPWVESRSESRACQTLFKSPSMPPSKLFWKRHRMRWSSWGRMG